MPKKEAGTRAGGGDEVLVVAAASGAVGVPQTMEKPLGVMGVASGVFWGLGPKIKGPGARAGERSCGPEQPHTKLPEQRQPSYATRPRTLHAREGASSMHRTPQLQRSPKIPAGASHSAPYLTSRSRAVRPVATR